MKTTRELIAEELRGMRAKKQLTLEAIAMKTTLDKMTISRYENNSVYEIDFNIFFKNIYANKQKIVENEEDG